MTADTTEIFRPVYALLLALAVLLIACSGSQQTAPEASAPSVDAAVVGDGDGNVGGDTDTAEEIEATEATVDPAGAEDSGDPGGDADTGDPGGDEDSPAPTVRPSPINTILGVDLVADSKEAVDARARQVDLAVRDCMQAEGFEYELQTIDIDITGRPDGYSSIDPNFTWGTPEYSARYGYGQTVTMVDDFIDFTTSGSLEAPTTGEQTYVETLGEAGRAAYKVALYGDQSSLDPGLSNDEARRALLASGRAGCFFVAWEDTRTPEERKLEAFGEQFGELFVDLEVRVAADPRVMAVMGDWRQCMGEKGYTFDDPSEPMAEITALVSDLTGRIFGESGPPGGVRLEGDALRELTDAEFDEYIKGFRPLNPEITPELQVEIDELTELEIRVASASIECGEGMRSVQDTVRRELEQRFVDDNEALIIAMLESLDAPS